MLVPELVAIPASPPFHLGRTPVTNAEYAPFVESGRAAAPPWWTDPSFSAARQPVVGVTWDDAMAYCAFLSEVAGGNWRLPTEAEWEVAACGGLVAPRTAWGDRVPPGEIPEGALAGPWEVGRGTPNALRALRRRHDRPRVVPRLGPRPARAAPPREPRRIVAARGALVGAVGADEPAAELPVCGLRVPGLGSGLNVRRPVP